MRVMCYEVGRLAFGGEGVAGQLLSTYNAFVCNVEPESS